MSFVTSVRRICLSVAACMVALAVAGASFASGDEAPSADAPSRLPNFRFTDVDGAEHELYGYRDAKAVVLFFQLNGCPIVRQSYPYFEQIKNEYADRGVEFLYINSNQWDSPESIVAERADFLFTPPVLIDRHRALAHYLQVERSADTFVIHPGQDWRIVYHGMADDRFDYGLQRMSPSKFWLRDALDAILAGVEPAHTETIAKGCLFDMDTVQGVIFEKHVQPIFARELAPLFSQPPPDEQTARKHTPEVLLTLLAQRLPDGGAVSLTDEQAEILVAWIFGAGTSAH